MREVIILGATGSIGTQALDVIRKHRDKYSVLGLAAGGNNLELVAQQVQEFRPKFLALAGVDSAKLEACDFFGVELLLGAEAATTLAGMKADVVLNAITGSAGLLPTLATLKAGTKLALANKESLVIGGKLVTEAAAPGQIIPVDSEHSAFAQCLTSGKKAEVRKLILTASGGPFRGKSRADLSEVSAAQALAHPTWNMGRVITINSATLVNKGLELLEAALLYDVSVDQIQVVVHPQSIVHSMVEYYDGSTIAQASPPDMRLPIALGLAWPDRLVDAVIPCDWTKSGQWTFEPLAEDVFPAVELARKCGRFWGTAPAVYNAANEILVDAFCAGKIGFLEITEGIAQVLEKHLENGFVSNDELSVADVLAADSWARLQAQQLLG